MDPNYELLYFHISARAGVPRLLFALADVRYNDTRLDFAEWGNSKSDTTKFPLGQMPVLRIDKTYIAESVAINDYLASKFGYHGSDDLERARVTMVSCAAQGLYTHWAAFTYMEKDPEKCKVLKEKLITELAPTLWGRLENILKQNKNGEGFFVGDKLSLADIFFVDIANTVIQTTNATTLDNYPCLKALYKRVAEMPAVKQELETRQLTF